MPLVIHLIPSIKLMIWSSDTDTEDGEARRSGFSSVDGSKASTLRQAVLRYLRSCSSAIAVGKRTTAAHGSNARHVSSSEANVAPPTAARGVSLTEQQEAARAHVLDVQTNCQPGPSFRRDDGGKSPEM